MPATIRKPVVQLDETRLEMNRAVEPPTRRALATAVIENPYAGCYIEQLDVAGTDSGRPLPRVGGLQVGEIKGEDGLR